MSLTPEDIEAQVFREKFKGYDQDEVDAFLDRVSDRIGELLKEQTELTDRLTTVEADARESIEAERLLKRTLITAQRTADETVAEAVAQAQSTIAEADQRAAQIVTEAQERAAQITGDAERSAAEALAAGRREVDSYRAAAEEQLRHVRAAVTELQRFRAEYRDRVRAAVAEQLAALDAMADVPDVPADMARLAGTQPEPAPEPPPPAQSALDTDPAAEPEHSPQPHTAPHQGQADARITGLDVGNA